MVNDSIVIKKGLELEIEVQIGVLNFKDTFSILCRCLMYVADWVWATGVNSGFKILLLIWAAVGCRAIGWEENALNCLKICTRNPGVDIFGEFSFLTTLDFLPLVYQVTTFAWMIQNFVRVSCVVWA